MLIRVSTYVPTINIVLPSPHSDELMIGHLMTTNLANNDESLYRDNTRGYVSTLIVSVYTGHNR